MVSLSRKPSLVGLKVFSIVVVAIAATIEVGNGSKVQNNNSPHTVVGGPAKTTNQPPHIVFILSDNVGYGNIGFTRANSPAGPSPEVLTPTLDELAETGVILDRMCT